MESGILLIIIHVQPHSKILDQALLLLEQMEVKGHMVFRFSMNEVFAGNSPNFATYVRAMHYPVILKLVFHDPPCLKILFIN